MPCSRSAVSPACAAGRAHTDQAEVTGVVLAIDVDAGLRASVGLNYQPIAYITHGNSSQRNDPLPTDTGAWAGAATYCRWDLKVWFGPTPQTNQLQVSMYRDPTVVVADTSPLLRLLGGM